MTPNVPFMRSSSLGTLWKSLWNCALYLLTVCEEAEDREISCFAQLFCSLALSRKGCELCTKLSMLTRHTHSTRAERQCVCCSYTVPGPESQLQLQLQLRPIPVSEVNSVSSSFTSVPLSLSLSPQKKHPLHLDGKTCGLVSSAFVFTGVCVRLTLASCSSERLTDAFG